MSTYTAIGGTHDWQRGQWFWCVDPETGAPVPFAAFMRTHGYTCRRRQGPFWSGMLGGVPFLKMRAWQFGAGVLKEWMERELHVNDRRIISVSHGGQVAMMACANGLQLHSLVTITMPQRSSMDDTYRAALKNIGTYTNVYSDSWFKDRWQIFGTLSDGSFRFRRTFELDGVDTTGVNIGIKGVGHTDLVRTNQMVLLKSYGVLDRL